VAARGISPDRVIFAPGLSYADHFSRLALADVFVDTWPYNAHTTASDALWAGVPIVTCAGDTFASRVAGSLLQAVGLPDLIAADAEDYVVLALSLARNPDRLAACKARLQRNRPTAPLFDVAAYTRALEDLYATMWARRCAGEAPAAIWSAEDEHNA